MPLKKQNVDTGMGLDRTLAVLNGQKSVYDTELFDPMFQVLELDQEIMTNDEVHKSAHCCGSCPRRGVYGQRRH